MSYKKYYTPPDAIIGLLKFINPHGKILECCCGKGAISNYLLSKKYDVITNDIDPSVNADFHFNAKYNWPYLPDIDWVISNPPYGSNEELEITRKALENAKHGVAMLLLISFLEGTIHRKPFHQQHPPNLVIITPRYRFSSGGTYRQTTAWFVWEKGLLDQKITWI